MDEIDLMAKFLGDVFERFDKTSVRGFLVGVCSDIALR